MATTNVNLASLSSSKTQVRAFYKAGQSGYDLEYICESSPGKLSTDNARRVCRIRYTAGTNNLVDKSFAINNISTNSKMSSYNKATNEFVFQATDQAKVEGYTYGDQLSSGMQILTFGFNAADNVSIGENNIVGVIDHTAKTIAVTLPALSVVTALKATFTNVLGSVVKIGATVQTAGTTANNFTNPVSYIVTDGIDTTTYLVTVTVSV